MNNFTISIAKDLNDAKIISDHIGIIWNSYIDEKIYHKMLRYITYYNNGFLIGYIGDEVIGSSIGFPMGYIPTFHKVNNSNIYELANSAGKYFYIHIIQILGQYRDKGFGIKFLKYQINNAKLLKIENIIAMSVEKQLKLWKRCGFKEISDFGTYKHIGKVKWIQMKVA